MADPKHSNSKGGKFLPALCNLLGTLIILTVILFCLSLILPKYLGYEVYHIVSGSMEPEISVGSLVYVEKVAPEDVTTGTVIAFQSGGSVVTHRVVENQFVVGEFVTKGDANNTEDLGTIPYSALVGQVVYHVPKLGQFMMIYTSPVGKLYVLGFALCGLLLNLVAGRLRQNRRAER